MGISVSGDAQKIRPVNLGTEVVMNSNLCATEVFLNNTTAVINSSCCAAPIGTHTVLNRSPSVLSVVARAGHGK